MAFLSKEDKFFWVKNLPSTEYICPGFYIPQSIHRKIKKSFAPFGSNVQRGTKEVFDYIPLNHSNNIFLFNTKQKFSPRKKNTQQNNNQNNKNEQLKSKSKKGIIEEKAINNFKSKGKIKKITKLYIDADESDNKKVNYYHTNVNWKKGNSNNKDINLKISHDSQKLEESLNKKGIEITDDKSKFPKTMSENWYSRIRTKYNNELLLEFERDKNLNKNAFISSIPSKAQSYGYIIEDNGSMTPKENPDAIKIFSGLGKDTVGPGNYDVNLKWNKTLSLWSKSKTKRFSSKYKRTKENIKKDFEKDMVEKDKYSKTYSGDWLNNNKYKLTAKYNLKSISLVGTKQALMAPNGKIITKSYDKPGRTDNFFINKLNVLNPGPGYYFEDDKWSCLKIMRFPIKKKKNYNFGSNVDRFEKINDDDDSEDENENPKEAYRRKLKEMKAKCPLPTTYFKEDLKRKNYLKEKFRCPQKTFYFKHIW